jgi:hypothetical protein
VGGARVRAAAAAASAAVSLDDEEVGGGGRLARGSPWRVGWDKGRKWVLWSASLAAKPPARPRMEVVRAMAPAPAGAKTTSFQKIYTFTICLLKLYS